MKKLIIYYSYTGNTLKIAEKIKDTLHCDMVEIKPVIPYSSNYQTVVDEAEKQVPEDYQPAIEKIEVDLNTYDEIILATPVWWYTVASPVNTFLHQYDISTKTIIPVATNGGWLGHTIEDIENLSKGTIKNPISIEFNGDKLVNESTFQTWLTKLGE